MRTHSLLLAFVGTVCATSLVSTAESKAQAVYSVSPDVTEALNELHQAEYEQKTSPTKEHTTLITFARSLLKFTSIPVQAIARPITGIERPVQRLRDAASAGDDDAMFLLAEMSFHGNYTYPRNYHDALQYYTRLAERTGNVTALEQVALLHSTGINGIEVDQGLALTYHSFAANQGSMRSKMALGYRNLLGIGVSKNCTVACQYYGSAAQQAVDWMLAGPPGGIYWQKRAFHFSDDHGGLYGSAPPRFSYTTDASDIDDVIDYYTYLAERADLHAAYSLAKLYGDGSRTVKQDFVKSLFWFRQVAKSYWTKDGKVVKNAKLMKMHAKSAAYIGISYLRGEGTEQDFEKAKMWFQRGIALGETISQNGYGLMHLLGLGTIKKDAVKAEELFKAAADNDHKAAQINLGKILAARGDVNGAARYFESAARAGRVEAFFYLAQFYEHGVGREANCAMATQYYKIVAESVETLHSTIPFGNAAYFQGHVEDAIIANLIAAESGYEIGQLNVAFLLDQHRRTFSIREIVVEKLARELEKWKRRLNFETTTQVNDLQPIFSDELALRYYSRSASQQNIEALVKAGDYYLEGHGTVPDPEKAVELWTAAADTRMMPLALWNLGWSYENGIGVDQDFHLAKRYYDACLEVDKRSYLPVSLSLFKLRIRSAWNTVTGGSINSIRDEDEAPVKITWSAVWQGIRHFWRAQFDHKPVADADDAASTETWVDEDYPSTGDDIYETLLILSICLFVGFAVYLRTAWTQRRQPAGHVQNAPAGVVPGPDPHIAEWIVRPH